MPTSDRTKSPAHDPNHGNLYASFRRVVTTTYAQGLFATTLCTLSYPC